MRKEDTKEKKKSKTDVDTQADQIDTEPSEFIGDDELLAEKKSAKKKQNAPEEEDPFAGMSYEERINAHRRMIKARILCGVIAVLILAGVFVAVRHFVTYSSYRVTDKETRSSGMSVQYAEYYGKVLRYSKDGAVFYEKKDKVIWNATYEMHKPVADVCSRYAVIADQYGTSVCVFNLEGKTADFDVPKPIQKVQVSEKGSVALLLQDGQEHILQYYDAEGKLLAEGRLAFEKSGYPLDMSLSDDGLKLAVSYLLTENGTVSDKVEFYSFSSIGAKEIDNVVATQTFENVMIPTVYYADDKTAFAFGEDRLLIFRGSQRPELVKEISIEEEIQSIFYNEKYAGMVFRAGDGYRMDVYDLDGKKILSKGFEFAYTDIKLSKDKIIMYNSKEWCVYTLKGRMRLSPCELDGSVTDIVALSGNKFLLVKANKTQTVKLKL